MLGIFSRHLLIVAAVASPTYATALETRPVPRPAVVHATATDLEAAAVVAQVAVTLGHEGGYNVYVDGVGLVLFQNTG